MGNGKPEQGLARIYRCLRENPDDVEAASLYLIALIAAPNSLPSMEEKLPHVVAGSSVSLVNEFGGSLTITIDPSMVDPIPSKGEFHAPTDAGIGQLLGVPLGASVDIPQAFGAVRRYAVRGIMSAYRRGVQLAHEKINSALKPPPHILSVPVPHTENGVDFSHIHAQLKMKREHAQRAFEAYANSPITLGILAKVLGTSVVELVSAWPSKSNGPALFTCTGAKEEREEALTLLARDDAPYVTDAATLSELVFLKCEGALAALPKVYVSSATLELLDSLLEEEREGKATGFVQDIDGVMGYVDITEADRASRIARRQSLVDAARRYCQAAPVYGPERLPSGLEKAEHVLARDEYEALLLAAEKNATLITLDGRLAMLALQALETKPVSVQALLMHAETKGALEPAACSYACVLQFLANRTFVSLRARDLVTMCLQGGYFLHPGLQRFKEYLANPNTNLESAARVALEFLELQSQQFTQVAAFAEILSHIVEALLRHPACVRDELLGFVTMHLQHLVEGLIPESPYPFANLHIEEKRRKYYELFAAALQEAMNMAAGPISKRAIRLKVLACTRIPMLVYDGSNIDSEAV